MSRRLRGVAPALAAVAWLGVCGHAAAVFPPPIKDEGKFFSKEAVEKANKKIREVYEKYRKDVVVETLNALTPEQEKKLKEEGDEKRFFARLALERSRELGLNGVFVLISRKPRYLWIHQDPETQKRMFTSRNSSAARDKIIEHFRTGEFDQGLAAGLEAIEAAFKANAADKRP
jgi:uncharacterized membrane protein YgcG